MYDTTILEVAIGVAFIYLLLSLMVTAIFEVIATKARFRHKELWRGVQCLVGGATGGGSMAGDLMNHPLIRSISAPDNVVDKVSGVEIRAPSNLSANLFSTALLDQIGLSGSQVGLQREIAKVVAGYPDAQGSPEALAVLVKEHLSRRVAVLPGSTLAADLHPALAAVSTSTSVAGLKSELLDILGRSEMAFLDVRLKGGSGGPTEVHRTLRALASDGVGNFDEFKGRVEAWYDEGMRRTSGWYARKAQTWVLVLATLLTLGMNVDSIAIVKKLSSDSTLRRALVAQAESFVEENRPHLEQLAPAAPDGTTVAVGDGATILFHPNPVSAGMASIGRISRRTPASVDLSYQLRVLGSNASVVLNTNRVMMPKGNHEADFIVMVDTTNRSYSVSIEVTDFPGIAGVLRVKPDPGQELERLNGRIVSLGLPIGWESNSPINIWTAIPGWLMSIAAISLGAPFWFDLLTKLMKLRAPSGAAAAPVVPGPAPAASPK
jgi:hypothetical protein